MKKLRDSIWVEKGDCLDLMKEIPDGKIDLILTDPPYGTTRCKWDSVIPFEPMWEQLHRITKPNGAICLFGSEPFSSLLRVSNIKNFKYDWVWDKSQKSNFLNAKKQPLRSHEIISVFYKKQCTYNYIKTTGHTLKTVRNIERSDSDLYNKQYGSNNYNSTERYPHSILKYKKDTQRESLHPTQKPVSLLEYLIKTYTNENELVLDFTMGSGSTGVACLNTGRRFIGYEKDDKYFDIACERMLNHTVK